MKPSMGMAWRVGLLGLIGLELACATEPMASEEPEHPWSAPPLERVVAVHDGRTGEELTFDELLGKLASADVVFLGEQHTDETTHRVELAVYEGLLARRSGRVVLALEMFERDVQAVLSQYVAGEIEEPEFLESARPWSNYRTAYRPMVERARRDGGTVVAANFPVTLRRKLAMEGEGVLDQLEGEEANWAPAELMANTPEYWRRVDNAVRGHIGMMGGPRDPSDPRLTDTQSLWDNSMGDACANALDDHPGSSVLHVNGGFHSTYWDGTTRQLMLRKPDAKVLTVDIDPVSNPALNSPSGKPAADYVVYAARRAVDVDSGRWSVVTGRELKYRIQVPKSATDEARVPLLIWLGEAGLTARDGIALWKERLGQDVAILALETPYREIAEDLGDGGRWFWPDTFPEDIGVMSSGIHGAWGYALRNFPLDGERVALVGEGEGATVVSAISLLSDLPVESLAFAPRKYAKIKDFPLPLPEARGSVPPADKRLTVFAVDGDSEWWSEELDEYTAIGFANELRSAAGAPWDRELKQENSIRAALGLEARVPLSSEGRLAIEVPNETVRAAHWARLAAQRESSKRGVAVFAVESGADRGSAELIKTKFAAADYREGKSLPRCPGPFGGTTVVVLPDQIGESEREEWLELARPENDPLTMRSRFLRLRVAYGSGETGLEAVLEKLDSENRHNILIVPAEFCANGDTMRSTARKVRSFEDTLTIHWLPGLGGE